MKEHLLYRDTILTFKCINGLAPSYLCDKLEKRNEIHDRDIRNNKKLQIPQYRTTCGQRTFKYRATKIWNALDKHNVMECNAMQCNAMQRKATQRNAAQRMQST